MSQIYSHGLYEELIQRCNEIDVQRTGAVQAHAAIVVVSEDNSKILQASANISAFIPDLSPKHVGGAAHECEGIAELLRVAENRGTSQGIRTDVMFQGRFMTVSVDRTSDGVGNPAHLISLEVVEFPGSPLLSLGGLKTSLLESRDAPALCAEAVRVFATLTQFDRILLYRFLPDWSGEVIGEYNGGYSQPYLHLRFPASDLPESARQMYRTCQVRVIGDSQALPVPLVSMDGSDSSFDLSLSPARSVSETHRVYLQNMEVRSSVSFPITRGDALWGLIACHHRTPRVMCNHIRSVGVELASLISSKLLGFDAEVRMGVIYNSATLLDRLLDRLGIPEDLEKDVSCCSNLLSWLAADGFGFFDGDTWHRVGVVPDEMVLLAIRDKVLVSRLPDGVLMIENLESFLGMKLSDTVAGMMAVGVGGGICVWFRPEVVSTIEWAGKPDVLVDTGAADGLLRPRGSFSKWVEERRGHSAPWTEFDRHKAVVWRSAFMRRFAIPEPEMWA